MAATPIRPTSFSLAAAAPAARAQRRRVSRHQCALPFFRYTDGNGAVYRPHLTDRGQERVDPGSGKYVHDLYGDRRSRLAFLIYLNDGFAGGCTTFYMPSVGGGLRVASSRGRVRCSAFPGTLRHCYTRERGTKGTKDVIRTDVLYYTPAAK